MRNDLFPACSFSILCLAATLGGCAPTTTGETLTSTTQVFTEAPLAVGPGGIFFFNDIGTNGTTLCRIPLAGGPPTVLDANPPEASVLLADQDSVFYGGNTPTTGAQDSWAFTIARVPQAGGTVETLATGTDPLVGMALGGSDLVYATMTMTGTEGFDEVTPGTGSIFVQPIVPDGQPLAKPALLAQGLPQPCSIAADSANVYWLDCTSQEVLSLPLSASAGQKPAVLATGLGIASFASSSSPFQLTAAAGQLYWIEGVEIRTVPVTGGTPSTIASESDWLPGQIMADGAAVYWRTDSNYSGGAGDGPDVNDRDPGLWRASPGGGSVTQVLGNDAAPGATAMDASFVYWSDEDDGSVHRLAR